MNLPQFRYYEFAGILTPGVTVIVASGMIFPDTVGPFMKAGLSLGDLGVVVIVGFVVGHLMQAVGNLLEEFWWWAFGGRPTDWIGNGRVGLLNAAQFEQLENCIETRLGLKGIKLTMENRPSTWLPVTKQINALVEANEMASRVQTFSGNYGMFRGLAAGFLVIFAMMLISEPTAGWPQKLLVLSAFALALYRMDKFGKHYARELFVQFLCLPSIRKEL